MKKVIFSHWQANTHFFIVKEFAELAHKFVKKHGYETILYTDEIGRDLLQDINYDQIIILDKNILDKFPKRGWSLGKILAMSMIKEPFFHIDFDLFLREDLDEDFKKSPIFSFHQEHWVTRQFAEHKSGDFLENNYYPEFYISIKEFLERTENICSFNLDISEIDSCNCAIVGGNNYQAFNKAAEYVINFGLKYKDVIDNFYTVFPKIPDWFCAVFLEQILFMKLVQIYSAPENINFYLKGKVITDLNIEAAEKKITHIWGLKEQLLDFQIEEIVSLLYKDL